MRGFKDVEELVVAGDVVHHIEAGLHPCKEKDRHPENQVLPVEDGLEAVG